MSCVVRLKGGVDKLELSGVTRVPVAQLHYCVKGWRHPRAESGGGGGPLGQ